MRQLGKYVTFSIENFHWALVGIKELDLSWILVLPHVLTLIPT